MVYLFRKVVSKCIFHCSDHSCKTESWFWSLGLWSFFNKVNEFLSTSTGRRLSLNQFWFSVVRTTRATPLPEPKPIESKASAGLFQVSCADHLSDYFQIPTLLFWQHFSRSIPISLSVLYSYCSKKHNTNCKELYHLEIGYFLAGQMRMSFAIISCANCFVMLSLVQCIKSWARFELQHSFR